MALQNKNKELRKCFLILGVRRQKERDKQLQIRVHLPLENSCSEVLVGSWYKQLTENRSPLPLKPFHV